MTIRWEGSRLGHDHEGSAHLLPNSQVIVGTVAPYGAAPENPSFCDRMEDGVADMTDYRDHGLVEIGKHRDSLERPVGPEQLATGADSARKRDQGATPDPPLPL
jgi:hypothetical protein